MQDLDWYLDLGGKKSGPFAVEDIIARYKNGEIPTSAYVTAQRMKGEWVRITDLAEAYRDLFQLNDGPSLTPSPASSLPPAPQTRTNIPRPNLTQSNVIDSTSPRIDRPSSSSSGRFQAPPRPTEQLEASKLITLNPPGSGSNQPDATESLFQAIQAIREKNQMKTHPPSSRDNWGELSRPKKVLPAQGSLYLVLIGIMVAAAYATYEIVQSRKENAEEAALAKKPATPQPTAASQTPSTPSGKLLNDPQAAGGGVIVRPAPRSKNLTSPAGGNIRLTTPTRIDDEEEERGGQDEEEDMGAEPVEEDAPVLQNSTSAPNPMGGANGSYPVDGSEDGAEGLEGGPPGGGPRTPIGEGAIDPNTGAPIGP